MLTDPGCNLNPNACQNNGTCNAGLCTCAVGFSGPTCGGNLKMKSIVLRGIVLKELKYPWIADTCDATTCNNQGTCSVEAANGNAPVCTCNGNFDPAKNCGTCVSGFSGPTCSGNLKRKPIASSENIY